MLRLSYEKRNHGGSNEGCSEDQSKTKASLFNLCIDKSFMRALFSLSFLPYGFLDGVFNVAHMGGF